MKSNLDLKGNLIGYISNPCPNCGRIRVEKYENGELRCEKCEWDLTKNEYEPFEWVEESEDEN